MMGTFQTRGLKTHKLTYDLIKKEVNEYSLWCYYIQSDIKLGKKIISPVRSEKDPSAAFFLFKGSLLLKDFGTGEVYNVIKYLETKYNLTYLEAIKQIDSDFGLQYFKHKKVPLIASNAVIKDFNLQDTETKIYVKRKPWNQAELDYWTEYNITRESLDKYFVSPLKCYWVSKNEDFHEFCKKSDELLFVFSFNNALYKIYRPYGKDNKWSSNVPGSILMGYDQLPWLGEHLIVSKGMKELCILNELGYNAVSLQSENQFPDYQMIQTLKHRFKNIWSIFDSDKAGTEASKKGKELGFTPIFLPEFKGKDLAEYSKLYGLTEVKKLLYDIK